MSWFDTHNEDDLAIAARAAGKMLRALATGTQLPVRDILAPDEHTAIMDLMTDAMGQSAARDGEDDAKWN